MNKRSIGRDYEEKASAYLKESGFRVLERNFSCRQGEVDIIGIHKREHKPELVFVEVKYRRNKASGYPEEAVNLKKQEKICRTADYYRLCHPAYGSMQVRYDVVTICGEHLQWYQNAFDHIFY